MEADDALGIYATWQPGNIIVSPDKDMRQIPGELFDLTNPVQTITKEEGDRWHYVQTMAGDATDGYSVCHQLELSEQTPYLMLKDAHGRPLLKPSNRKTLGEDIALQNARLAKILQYENYPNGIIELWTPPDADNNTDTGAGSEAKTAAGSAASADKEDIITLLMALQRQNFAMANTIKQMLKEWPTASTPQTIIPVDQLKSGTSSETKS